MNRLHSIGVFVKWLYEIHSVFSQTKKKEIIFMMALILGVAPKGLIIRGVTKKLDNTIFLR